MILIRLSILLYFTLFLIGCQNSGSVNQSEANQPTTTQDQISEESASAGISTATINDVVKSYLDLKDALVNSNAEQASEASKALMKTLEGNPDLEKMGQEIMNNAAKITEVKELNHQREHFETISNNLYQLVKANQDAAQTLYYQYCPMAFDNKGAYWLSSSQEIRNPYFGDQMLKCGSTKETLN
jgi:Cu(I)/Ag(I) efflux system membrane fusion protein